MTANSSRDNFRPIVPAWNRDNTALLWFRGTYTSAQIFSTQVVGVLYHHPVGVAESKKDFSRVFEPSIRFDGSDLQRGEVTVRYSLQERACVDVGVYSLSGKLVATLARGERAAGSYHVTWRAHDIPAGTYLCRMRAGGYSSVATLALF